MVSRHVIKPQEGGYAAGMDAEPTGERTDGGLVTYRIAILAFDDVASLMLAGRDLLLNGFQASQFCLLARRPVFEAVIVVRPVDGIAGELSALFAVAASPAAALAGRDAELRCGARACGLFTSEMTDGAGVPPTAGWIRPDLRSAMSDSVAAGQIVLLISSSNARQHALGGRLLLRHGRHDLYTREFSLPV